MKRVLELVGLKKKNGISNDEIAYLEEIIIKNRQEIDKLKEEVEAINILYERYRLSHKKILICFSISIVLNVILAGVLLYLNILK